MIIMKRIVFTDLDGTLLDNDWKLSKKNHDTLLLLGEKGVVRTIVTGRSLYSARKILEDDFPIDYLVFSTGAGIMNWKKKELLLARNIPEDTVIQYAEILLEEKINFMLHREIPESHYFYYYEGDETPPDFHKRVEIYTRFAQPFRYADHACLPATQFLSILSPDRFPAVNDFVKRKGLLLSTIKTTSPLLKNSLWLEIYAPDVSKGYATEYLAERLRCCPSDCMAIGNDFNDLDMLEWSRNSFVVGNSPKELKRRYKTVAVNEADGFSEAVESWVKNMM